jgi:D-alanine transaminase
MEPVVYLNGQFLPKTEARISPDDRGFVYADGVYEVIRYYRGQLFEIGLHEQRLQRSLEGIQLSGVVPEMMTEIGKRLIRENGHENLDGIIYFQATRGAAPRKHPFPKDIPPTVYATATVLERPLEKLENGVPVLLMEDIRWSRCDIKSISLLPNVMASEAASAAGCYETLFHRDGWVTEASRSNVFARIRGVWHTHPADRYILNGVTRIVAIERMKELGLQVKERAFSLDDLRQADEVFICSTTSEIMPVVSIAGRTIADGKPGTETRALQKAFSKGI